MIWLTGGAYPTPVHLWVSELTNREELNIKRTASHVVPRRSWDVVYIVLERKVLSYWRGFCRRPDLVVHLGDPFAIVIMACLYCEADITGKNAISSLCCFFSLLLDMAWYLDVGEPRSQPTDRYILTFPRRFFSLLY